MEQRGSSYFAHTRLWFTRCWFVFHLPSGRTDDGQHLAVGSGEHVPLHGGPPIRERQLPAVLLAVEAAGHHAGDLSRV